MTKESRESPRGCFRGCALLLLIVMCPVSAADFQGRVLHVVDGDALVVAVGNQRLTIQLKNVDAPELKQPYGIPSRQSLIAICGGEIATVDQSGKVQNARTSGRVMCNGTDAGAEQVRRGLAWVFGGNDALDALQKEARAARRGLWAQGQPVPPWEWRSSARQ